MVMTSLTRGKWGVPDNEFNASILERIDAMTPKEMHEYDQHKATDMWRYTELRHRWKDVQKYFLGKEVGHDPTDTELIEYMGKRKSGLRFHALYCESFPEGTHVPGEWRDLFRGTDNDLKRGC